VEDIYSGFVKMESIVSYLLSLVFPFGILHVSDVICVSLTVDLVLPFLNGSKSPEVPFFFFNNSKRTFTLDFAVCSLMHSETLWT